MAGRDETKTVGEPGKAQTGRKKMTNLRIGGPGILVGALAVAFVVGAAVRIRRYRSLQKAKKRLQCSSRDYSNGGLRSILQADRHCPRYSVDGTSEMIWDSEEEALEDSSELGQDNKSNDLSEYEIQIEKIGENEGDEVSDTDHGEWKTIEISESSAEEEHLANEAGEEKYDDAEDSFAGNEAEGENDVTDDEYEDKDEDEDEDEDDGECIVEKCEEGSQGTEASSMESNAEVVWPEEMKEWPL